MEAAGQVDPTLKCLPVEGGGNWPAATLSAWMSGSSGIRSVKEGHFSLWNPVSEKVLSPHSFLA